MREKKLCTHKQTQTHKRNERHHNRPTGEHHEEAANPSTATHAVYTYVPSTLLLLPYFSYSLTSVISSSFVPFVVRTKEGVEVWTTGRNEKDDLEATRTAKWDMYVCMDAYIHIY